MNFHVMKKLMKLSNIRIKLIFGELLSMEKNPMRRDTQECLDGF